MRLPRAPLAVTILLLLGCTGMCGGLADNDNDGQKARWDCNDDDPLVNGDATEVCDGIDNDCDAQVDEGTKTAFFMDEDGDGYGDDATEDVTCEASEGWITEGGDCDDSDATIHPAAEEDCTEDLDRNCDGSSGYDDADGDGVPACEDCDDSDGDAFPGADETCDGTDEDCDGEIDEDAVDALTRYRDADGDGYGNPDKEQEQCSEASGWVDESSDCDDGDADVHPGATEICDAVDNDCSGAPLEAAVPSVYATIQDAVDAGQPWICLEPGDHVGDVDISEYDGLIEPVESAETTAIVGTGSGAAVRLSNSDLTLRDVRIENGDPALAVYSGRPVLEELTLSDNSIPVVTCETCDLEASDWLISGNSSVGNYDALVVVTSNSAPWFERVTVSDNDVQDASLAMEGGAFRCTGNSEMWLQNVAIAGNVFDLKTTNGLIDGVAVYVEECTASATNLIVAGNEVTGAANSRGLLYVEDGGITVENASLVGNEWALTASLGGTAVRAQGDAYVELVNVDVSHNETTWTAYDVIACNGGNNDVSVSYSNAWDNPDDDLCSEATGSFGAADPGYVDISGWDPMTWDLELDASSALIDAGHPHISDPDGSVSDIGAFGGPGASDW